MKKIDYQASAMRYAGQFGVSELSGAKYLVVILQHYVENALSIDAGDYHGLLSDIAEKTGIEIDNMKQEIQQFIADGWKNGSSNSWKMLTNWSGYNHPNVDIAIQLLCESFFTYAEECETGRTPKAAQQPPVETPKLQETANNVRRSPCELEYLKPPYVETEKFTSYGISVTEVKIHSESAAQILEKRCGLHIVMETGMLSNVINLENVCSCLKEQLQPLLSPFFEKPILICGIGNCAETHDSLGPEVARRIRPYMYDRLQVQSNFETVAVVCTDVIEHTNLPNGEIINGIASQINAASVLAIDSSICTDAKRLCSAIQLTDTGLISHSTIPSYSQSTMEIPIISIDMPTVFVSKRFSQRDSFDPGLLLKPTNVSENIQIAAFVIACPITQIIYPDLDYDQCNRYIELFLNGI